MKKAITKLALVANGVNNEARPRLVFAPRGGDLTHVPKSEVHMPAVDSTGAVRLRHPPIHFFRSVRSQALGLIARACAMDG